MEITRTRTVGRCYQKRRDRLTGRKLRKRKRRKERRKEREKERKKERKREKKKFHPKCSNASSIFLILIVTEHFLRQKNMKKYRVIFVFQNRRLRH